MQKHNLHKDRRYKLPSEKKQHIFKYRKQGWTYRAIASEYGLSVSRVAAIFYELVDKKSKDKEAKKGEAE